MNRVARKSHTYRGPGRLWRRRRRVNFNRLIKTDATVGVNTTNYEHTYAGKKHLGSIDVTNQQQPVNGKVWRWEGGAGNPSADPSGTSGVAGKPIESPQRSSASNTQYYMLNDERTIEKRSYQVGGITAGDTNDDSRYAEWQHVNGAIVPTRVAIGIPSELFNAYNITLDADRASSAATSHALQLGATDLEYEVTRVKSPVIGRDMNPMGRGDGTYYCNGGNASGGSIQVRELKPKFAGRYSTGVGNGVNHLSITVSMENPYWDGSSAMRQYLPFLPDTGVPGYSGSTCGAGANGTGYFGHCGLPSWWDGLPIRGAIPPVGGTGMVRFDFSDAGSEEWRKGGWQDIPIDPEAPDPRGKGRWVKVNKPKSGIGYAWHWYRDIELACAYSKWGTGSVCKYYGQGKPYAVDCCVNSMNMEQANYRARMIIDGTTACWAWAMVLDPEMRGVYIEEVNAVLVTCRCAEAIEYDDEFGKCLCGIGEDKWTLDGETWSGGRLEYCYWKMLVSLSETKWKAKRLSQQECIDVCYSICLAVSLGDTSFCRECCEDHCYGSSYTFPYVVEIGVGCGYDSHFS